MLEKIVENQTALKAMVGDWCHYYVFKKDGKLMAQTAEDEEAFEITEENALGMIQDLNEMAEEEPEEMVPFYAVPHSEMETCLTEWAESQF